MVLPIDSESIIINKKVPEYKISQIFVLDPILNQNLYSTLEISETYDLTQPTNFCHWNEVKRSTWLYTH